VKPDDDHDRLLALLEKWERMAKSWADIAADEEAHCTRYVNGADPCTAPGWMQAPIKLARAREQVYLECASALRLRLESKPS